MFSDIHHEIAHNYIDKIICEKQQKMEYNKTQQVIKTLIRINIPLKRVRSIVTLQNGFSCSILSKPLFMIKHNLI